jgi:hypothetical protein
MVEPINPGPSFERAMDEAIERKLADVHTCLPGKVLKVNLALGMVDVQPLLKKKYLDETVVDIPPITNVPLATYRAGKAFISLPVKKGDSVLLFFSERSLDRWLAKGGSVDPADPRKFDLSDAIAYPGLYPFTDPPLGVSTDNIVIRNNLASIELQPNGKIKFQGSLFSMVDVMISQVDTLLSLCDVLTAFQDSNNDTPNATTLTAISIVKLSLQNIKLQLGSFN